MTYHVPTFAVRRADQVALSVGVKIGRSPPRQVVQVC